MNTSILFSLNFVNNTTLWCFFSFFLIITLWFLILAAVAKIFNSIAELVIPMGSKRKDLKAEIKIYLVIVEAKSRKFSA